MPRLRIGIDARRCFLVAAVCLLIHGCSDAVIVFSGPATQAVAEESNPVALLHARCTSCHDLGGLEAFKGFYDGEEWRDLVNSMVDYGAELDANEADIIVAYLAENYGPGAR